MPIHVIKSHGHFFIYSSGGVLYTTYSAWGQQGCVEGRGRRRQREAECWISLPRRTWALSPYALSPAGQQTLWSLNLGGRNMGDSALQWKAEQSIEAIETNEPHLGEH